MFYLLFFCVLKGFALLNLTWGAPAVSLDSNPPIGDTDSNASVAIDPRGNALAVWSRTTGKTASEEVWASYYNHSLHVWAPAVKLSGDQSAQNPQVAIDEIGNATVVWDEGFPTQIRTRTFRENGIWTPNLASPSDKICSSINAQTFPQIQADARGNLLAIYKEYYEGQEHLHSCKKEVSSSWTDLGCISNPDANIEIIQSKALALNKKYFGIATWCENQGKRLIVSANFFKEGKWQAPFWIPSTSKEKISPAAAINEGRKAAIVWNQDNHILCQVFENENFSDRERIISDPKYICTHPDVGIDRAGNVLVVFEKYNASYKFISSAARPYNSTTWSKPLDISAPNPASDKVAGFPILSLSASGDGVAIWKKLSGSNIIIEGAGYSMGSWSNTKALSSATSNSATTSLYDISVVMNDTGNILAIWPEDPELTGSAQIKSTAGMGLANLGPPPPTATCTKIENGIAQGEQMVHRFPAHTDLINILKWDLSEEIDHYNIYRNNLCSLVGSTPDPYFEDHRRKFKTEYIYLITAVDVNGQESAPLTMEVKSK